MAVSDGEGARGTGALPRFATTAPTKGIESIIHRNGEEGQSEPSLGELEVPLHLGMRVALVCAQESVGKKMADTARRARAAE